MNSPLNRHMNTLSITGVCFDGVSAQPQAAQFIIEGGNAVLRWAGAEHNEKQAQIDWGHTTQHGVRLITFANGAQFQAQDAAALNAYLAQHRAGLSWVDRATGNWQAVAACALGVVAVIGALYVWGIPAAAQVAAPHVPQSIKNTLGENALKGLDSYAFSPSAVSAAEQAQILARWHAVLEAAYPNKDHPQHRVVFRKMGIVPNALALPDGTLVLTDGLIALLADKPNAITGVLAHELGHIQHHHSMRALIQVSSMGFISTMVLGDLTVWVNQLPLLLGQMRYSRGHEAQADDTAIRIMQAAKINPAELAVFFERAEKITNENTQSTGSQAKPRWTLPDMLRSHPNSADRMDKLNRAAQ